VFDTDELAGQLFVSPEKWNIDQRELTAMPSLPGAGNTWVRLLMEQGCGLRTGSVFGDVSLKRMGFAGEGIQDSSVAMVKLHYPTLGEDLKGAERLVWLVRHPLTNIVAQVTTSATRLLSACARP
jgi:hypothetical protein